MALLLLHNYMDFICFCVLSTTISYPIFAAPNVRYGYQNEIEPSAGEIQPQAASIWVGIVIGWAVGKFVLDPLWEEVVEVYEEVNDYFVALRRQNALEAEARRLFYELYPDGQVISSGSSVDGKYYYIPYDYRPIPY